MIYLNFLLIKMSIYVFKNILFNPDGSTTPYLKIGYHSGVYGELRLRYATAFPDFDCRILFFSQVYEAEQFECYIKKLWIDKRYRRRRSTEHYLDISLDDVIKEISIWHEKYSIPWCIPQNNGIPVPEEPPMIEKSNKESEDRCRFIMERWQH